MSDFKLSQLFGIPITPKKAKVPPIVCWLPPKPGCIKINCDGSSFGSTSGSIGFILRNSNTDFMGAVCQNICHATALEAEFCAFMLAIEKCKELGLTDIWLETDSLLVVKAFHSMKGIPWRLQARWWNCMMFCKKVRSQCSHILRHANLVADALAKNGQGLACNSFQWWPAPPTFILHLLYSDSLGVAFS